MNDPVIERIVREDPARHAHPGDQVLATRARVFAAIDQQQQPAWSGRRRTGLWLASAAAVAAVVVVAVVALIAAADHPHRTIPASHIHHDTAPARPIRLRSAPSVDLGQPNSPEALLTQGRFLWVATPANLVKLDLQDGQTIARTPIPNSPIQIGLASGAGSIWLASTGSSQLLRINPATNRLIATIPLVDSQRGVQRSLGSGVAYADGQIWVSRVSNRPHGDVITVDPATNRPTGTPIAVGSGPDAVVSGLGSLWVQNTSVTLGDGTPSQIYPAMSRIDPRTRAVRSEPFSGTPARGFGSMWIQTNAAENNAAVLRVDPTGQTLARIAVPRVDGLAFGDGRVWAICDQRSRASRTFHPIKNTAVLRQIDPYTNQLIGTPIHLEIRPIAIAVSEHQLWIAGSGRLLHYQFTAG
jgi:hypothetical protein